MMRILVVDDESRAREGIVRVLQMEQSDRYQIAEADSLQTANQAIRSFKPDLLLLDIHLKDGTGFELAEALINLDIPVIFITAHKDYALRAFRISAMDYLLKPVDPDELIQSVEKALQHYEKKSWMQKFSVFLEMASKPQSAPKRIVLRTQEAIHVVSTDEIIYLEADRNYTTFMLKNRGKLLVSGSIGEYEALIGLSDFMRIHQSYLLNLRFIQSYEKASGMVITPSGDKLPVSSRKKDQLMQYLNSF